MGQCKIGPLLNRLFYLICFYLFLCIQNRSIKSITIDIYQAFKHNNESVVTNNRMKSKFFQSLLKKKCY